MRLIIATFAAGALASLSACSGEGDGDAGTSSDTSSQADASGDADSSSNDDGGDGLTLPSGAKLTNKTNAQFSRNADRESGRAFICNYEASDAQYELDDQQGHYASVEIELKPDSSGCLPLDRVTDKPEVITLKSKEKSGEGIINAQGGFYTTKLLTTASLGGAQTDFEMNCVREQEEGEHKMLCRGEFPVSSIDPDDEFGEDSFSVTAAINFVT